MGETLVPPSIAQLIADLQARVARLERGMPNWAFGKGTITWPGASAESDLISVNTGLSTATVARFAAIIPHGVAPGIAAPRRGLVGITFDYEATKPNLTGRLETIDAALNPAAATTNDYFWVVIL